MSITIDGLEQIQDYGTAMTEDLMCSSWVGNHNSAPPSSTVTSSGSWEPISSWVTVETKLRSPANK